ncbi:MAG TPA: hypothetical protein VGJ37_03165 [Pyrinomonadaceae bacterium]|jgi:hypothetical protein
MSNEKMAVREYYKRNVVFWALFVSYVPAMLFIGIPLSRLFRSENGAGIIATALFACIVAAALWRINWRCPRCDEMFYRKWWYSNAFSTRCVHCGFRPAKTRLNG